MPESIYKEMGVREGETLQGSPEPSLCSSLGFVLVFVLWPKRLRDINEFLSIHN